MPLRGAESVMQLARGLITGISFAKANVWTHGARLTRSKVQSVDVYLHNVGLLQVLSFRCASLLQPSNPQPYLHGEGWLNSNSCISFALVFLRCRFGGVSIPRSASKCYDALLDAEMPVFIEYIRGRFERKGIDPNNAIHNLQHIPTSVNSRLRLFMLQWLLNGLATSHRVAHFIDFDDVQMCFLCGHGPDSLHHLCHCQFACRLADAFGIHGQNLIHAWTPEKAAFKWQLQGGKIPIILRMNFALWRARRLVARGRSLR